MLPISRCIELIGHIRECGGWVFEDDYDGDLRLRGITVPPIHTPDPEHVFYSGTFNKTLFPAIRTGYLVVPENCLEAFSLFRLGISDWSVSIVSGALAKFIDEGFHDRHLFALKKAYRTRRETLIRELETNFGVAASVHGFEGGAHCRARIPCAKDWTMAENFGVKVATVTRYIHKTAPDQGESEFAADIILGYENLSEEEIVHCIARIKTFLS